MNHYGNGSSGVAAHSHGLRLLLGQGWGPLCLARVSFLGSPAGLVLNRLAIDLVERFANGDSHVGGFGDADNGMIANFYGDFGDVPVFLEGEDDVRIEC